jgi:hypothetical protein
MKTATILVAAIVAAITTAIMSSVATPAHAAIRDCPSPTPGTTCLAGGVGGPGGGFGEHITTNFNTGDTTVTGGQGHVGGSHFTANFFSGHSSCVGSRCAGSTGNAATNTPTNTQTQTQH